MSFSILARENYLEFFQTSHIPRTDHHNRYFCTALNFPNLNCADHQYDHRFRLLARLGISQAHLRVLKPAKISFTKSSE